MIKSHFKINKPCLFIFMLMPAIYGYPQLKNTGFYGTQANVDVCQNSATFVDDKEVTDLVTNMCDKMGFKNRYIIQPCTQVSNCQAVVYLGRPYILYNGAFLDRVKGLSFTDATLPAGKTDWKTLTILAHELGHHVNQHLVNPDPNMSQVDMELEADEFAGHMMHLLGATYEQAQAVMYDATVPLQRTYTHPGRDERLAAIKRGWDKVKPGPVSPSPVPPQNDNAATVIENSGIDMVYVQGGSFNMGSDIEADEKPVHRVTVRSFIMSKNLITMAQWREIMGTSPPYLKNCDNCPVGYVSWDDVQEFIRKLNNRTGKNYRLPTEAEWEFAARGGNNTHNYTYAGSSNINDVAWYTSNSGGTSHPVGQKQMNELGIYDMDGNMWQWCSDWYDDNYYASSPASHPQGPPTGQYRVSRGGSWDNDPAYCRIAVRDRYTPDCRKNDIGFRVAAPL